MRWMTICLVSEFLSFSHGHKFTKLYENLNFLAILVNIVICYKQKGYNIDVIKQFACLAVHPITVDYFAYHFNCTPVGRG